MVNEKLREINHNLKKLRIFVLKISSLTVPLLCLSDNTKAVAGVLHVNGVFWATFHVFYKEPITAFMQIPTLYVSDTDWFLLSALARVNVLNHFLSVSSELITARIQTITCIDCKTVGFFSQNQ